MGKLPGKGQRDAGGSENGGLCSRPRLRGGRLCAGMTGVRWRQGVGGYVGLLHLAWRLVVLTRSAGFAAVVSLLVVDRLFGVGELLPVVIDS